MSAIQRRLDKQPLALQRWPSPPIHHTAGYNAPASPVISATSSTKIAVPVTDTLARHSHTAHAASQPTAQTIGQASSSQHTYETPGWPHARPPGHMLSQFPLAPSAHCWLHARPPGETTWPRCLHQRSVRLSWHSIGIYDLPPPIALHAKNVLNSGSCRGLQL